MVNEPGNSCSGVPMSLQVFIVLAVSLMLWPPSVGAQAQPVRCTVTATPVAFSGYDVFSPIPSDSFGTVTIACNIPAQNPRAPVVATIFLSPGASGNFSPRQMQPLAGGSDRLTYNLYSDASMAAVWGDGTAGTVTLTQAITKEMPWNATIYGRIPARQNVRAGTYSDVITVTVLW
jgi:spore coat protein U-like protein